MSGDIMRSIQSVTPLDGFRLRLNWSDGTCADIAIAAGQAPVNFAKVALGDWGHSLIWPDGHEIGADSLWRDTLLALGRGDNCQFLDWRMRNGLSLAKAAQVLGISRRSVAYYSNGDRPVPRAILLACIGWEVESGLRKAA